MKIVLWLSSNRVKRLWKLDIKTEEIKVESRLKYLGFFLAFNYMHYLNVIIYKRKRLIEGENE